MTRYDLCVIGAGSAGVAAAEAARALGKRVLLVAGAGPLGGTCILRGCMPAKTLLNSTERLAEVRNASSVGVRSRATIDLGAVIARKRDLVAYFAADRVDEIESFEPIRSDARFVSPGAIEIDGKTVEAERFVIATGSTIDASLVACLSPGDYFTSDDALEMTDAPDRLIVIGGGPVGCEFAQYFARIGSSVTLVQDDVELLRYEDRDVGAAVRAALENEGVRVICDATIDRCERDGETRRAAIVAKAGSEILEADAIMLASGRIPNVASLGLDAAGVRTDARGGIIVDRYLASTNPRVYAAGDVLGRRCLVHVAVIGGTLAARNAFGDPRDADLERFESHAVYVAPQVAVAGLTEREARERGIGVRVRRHPFEEVGKAIVADESAGFVKMLAGDDGTILGIAIVGADAVELIGEGILAIDRRMTTRELAAIPHLHPTMGEIYARVAEDFETGVSDAS